MSQLEFCTRKCFSEKLLVTETKTMNLKMNKPVYIVLLIFEISNVAMCGYWLDYVKPRYGTTSKLCYMDNKQSHNQCKIIRNIYRSC